MILGLLLISMTSIARKPLKGSDYAIGFYNLENLFDTCHDEGKNDYEFMPEGTFKWDTEKYTNKLHNLARVLSEMASDRLPEGCAAIGVAEVENAKCLADLCNEPPLKQRNIQYIHVEGPDQRGIDCGLIYNPALFSIRDVKLVPYIYKQPEDSLRATRGFLVVSGILACEHVTIIVNHLPSRGAASYYREEGGRQLKVAKDSLLKADPNQKLLIMGDMNDDPQDASMAECLGAKREISEVGEGDLYNPWWNVLASGEGTLSFKGRWNLFDQIILSPSLLRQESGTLGFDSCEIFRRDYLIRQDGPYAGTPLRTHGGGQWLNGYSDHLPTPHCAAVIPLDSYYNDTTDLTPEERKQINFDHPDAFDWKLLTEQIKKLKNGEAVEQPTYSYVLSNRLPETVHIEPKPVIILEGIMTLHHKKLRDMMDLKIFVDTDSDVRLIRNIRRDVVERGRTVEMVLDHYENDVKPMHEQFIEPTKKFADLIIPWGRENKRGIDILRTYIQGFSQEVREEMKK